MWMILEFESAAEHYRQFLDNKHNLETWKHIRKWNQMKTWPTLFLIYHIQCVGVFFGLFFFFWKIGRKSSGYHACAAKPLISIRFAASSSIQIIAVHIFKNTEMHFLKNSQTKTCYLLQLKYCDLANTF